MQKGPGEQPWQTLGFRVQPQAPGLCAMAGILLFSPFCAVRGIVEVSTLWGNRPWRDAGMEGGPFPNLGKRAAPRAGSLDSC